MSADDLGKDLKRAHDWCDRQGLPKNEDLGERLAPWIDEHARALRFAASEMERLTREREEQARLRQVYQDAERLALLSHESWKARAEAAEADVLAQCSMSCRETERADKAEADNAVVVEVLKRFRERPPAETRPDSAQAFMRWHMDNERAADQAISAEHPGAALLEERDNLRRMHEANVEAGARVAAEFDKAGIGNSRDGVLTRALAVLEERKHITKTLDTMDVPSEADEAEKGRACDFAGRVELLATWGQRGWREYRKAKDSEAALLERLRKQDADICRMAEEIEAWKSATGLERGGDPDCVRPDDLAREVERLRAAEKVVEAGRSVHGALRLLDNEEVPVGLDEAEGDLGQALAAYDALREGA